MYKYIVIIVILVGLIFLVQKCGRKDPLVGNANKPVISDSAKLTDKTDKGDWKSGTPWNDGQKPIADNKVHIVLQPALGYLYDGKHKLDLDFRIAQWKNLGLNVGIGIGFTDSFSAGMIGLKDIVGWGGLSYQVIKSEKINTGLFIGITTKKRFCIGVQISL
jgi:hypothetical protein